jgi:hypothetical protein
MNKTSPKINGLKAYVPAKDFEKSKDFYSSLGFALTPGWGGTVDCELNGNQFRLQDYYVKEWAENFMMVMYVDNAQEWHQHVKAVLGQKQFPNVVVKDPESVGDAKVLHVIDPSGVLLVFVQLECGG